MSEQLPEQQEGPEFEGTARLGRALKGRLARRAIELQREGDPDARPFSFSELIALDTLEQRMEKRRELDELTELTRDPGADA
jgi:hypothetical protein